VAEAGARELDALRFLGVVLARADLPRRSMAEVETIDAAGAPLAGS